MKAFLGALRILWIIVRGGKRWDGIMSQSDFWFQESCRVFEEGQRALAAGDMPAFYASRDQRRIIVYRYKMETQKIHL